jgi:hypothetical protein
MTSSLDEKDDALSFTKEHLADQLGHLVPQIHLTLVSVLQGIALAFLLTSTHGPSTNSLTSLWIALLAHHLYLPEVASFLIVVIIWNEYAYAMLFLHWPLTALSTALQFLLAAVEIAAFTNVDTVGIWAFWIGVTALLGAGMHLRNVAITSDELYPYGSIARDIVGPNDRSSWGIGILTITLGIVRVLGVGPVDFAVTVSPVHVIIFDLLIPLLLIISALFVMREDNRFYVRNANKVFEKSGSLYFLATNGRIQQRAGNAQNESREHSAPVQSKTEDAG